MAENQFVVVHRVKGEKLWTLSEPMEINAAIDRALAHKRGGMEVKVERVRQAKGTPE
jgi:hypothetical protein